jgi:hypothetical protein
MHHAWGIPLFQKAGNNSKFWNGVTVTSTDCWVPQLSPNARGYICISIYGREGKKLRLHRYFYQRVYGPVPDHVHVIHSCDNRVCFNPDHLRPGLAEDNTKDMMDKGRGANQYGSSYTWR